MNTVLRIVSFDYNVLSALRPGPSESNFEKARGSLPGDGCVKWQFANVCNVSVTEGGHPGPGRKWGERRGAANTRGWRHPGPWLCVAGPPGVGLRSWLSSESPDSHGVSAATGAITWSPLVSVRSVVTPGCECEVSDNRGERPGLGEPGVWADWAERSPEL